jgi:glutamate-1-semialdehyde 2,1-aminomutase
MTITMGEKENKRAKKLRRRGNSAALFERAKKVLVGGVNSPVRAYGAVGGDPVFVRRGKGAILWDADGRRSIDFVGSWGPLILGHGPAPVLRAARRALRNGATFGAPTEIEVRIAELIRQAVPSMEKVRLVSSGTEAAMSAVRLARAASSRAKIVKFSGCYHGHADAFLIQAGSGALTLGAPTSPGIPEDVLRHTLVIPYNNADRLRGLLHEMSDVTAAVIVEPVAANMGVVPPAEGFLEALREATRRHGTILIFDEVVTGFRLSWGGAQRVFGVTPDLTCLGKIIGGGFPIGAFGGSAALMKRLSPEGPVYQAGTLSGNPVAVSAGLATLKVLRESDPYADLSRKTGDLTAEIRALARRFHREVTVNEAGSMFTIFFTSGPVVDEDSARRSDTAQYARFFHHLLDEGVTFPPSQFEACFVSTAHTDEVLKKALKAIHAAFKGL